MFMKLNKSIYGRDKSPLYLHNNLRGNVEARYFKPIHLYPCMFYRRDMIELIYVYDLLFFGPDQDEIYEVIKELEDTGISLTVEEDVYDLLWVEVYNDNNSVKVTLTQGGFTKKVLKKVWMLDSNKKITPEAKNTLGTETDGIPFDEPW